MGSTSERLPSFKGPRDLSLSARGAKRDANAASPGGSGQAQARSRRVFTPNIPPKRERGAGSGSSAQPSASTSKDGAGASGSGNARGRHQRGRGGGAQRGGSRPFKQRGELIQSESVFSDGIGNPVEGRRSSSMQYKTGYGGGMYKSATEKGSSRVSSMNRATLKTIIKEEDTDNETDKKLFGDDKFEEDDEEDTDPTNPNVPVVLPLISYAPEFFMEPAPATSVPEDDSEPVPGPSTSVASAGPAISVRIKQEKIDEDEPHSTLSLAGIKQEKFDGDDAHRRNDLKLLASLPLEPATFSSTFRSAPAEGTLVYFQLPDELPVLQGSVRDSVDSSSGKSSAELVQDIDELPEGFIGKLQILSSGRTRFVLGENIFDVDPGRPVGFRQELHSLDTESKAMTKLGPISKKFVITPDISSLIIDDS